MSLPVIRIRWCIAFTALVWSACAQSNSLSPLLTEQLPEPAKDFHHIAERKTPAMSAATKCTNNLLQSICRIELILAELRLNYDRVSGGGVSSIEELPGQGYVVRLPQEEAVDVFTYEFELKDSELRIKRKTYSVEGSRPAYPTPVYPKR